MKIDDKHLYHGAALAQIIEHPSFTALNRESHTPKAGHYLINHNIHLFIKYSTNEGEWQFTFKPQDIKNYRTHLNDESENSKLFLCLVCYKKVVGVLEKDAIKKYLDLASNNQQWIKVIEKDGKCRTTLQITSSYYQRKDRFQHKNVPDILFK